MPCLSFINQGAYNGDTVNLPDRPNTPVEEIWECDQQRLNQFRTLGYETFVIWESDWKNDPRKTIKNLSDWYDECRLVRRKNAKNY